MIGRRFLYREVVPFAAMIAVECLNVGQNTIYKAAVSKGMNYHVFMVYSYAISALVLLPLAFLFHRQTSLPPLSITMLAKFFVLGFFGFAGQYLGYLGVAYSNPTLGSAMSNLNPACTFFLAVLFRMERLKFGSPSTMAKILGALVSISGALVVVLYNGPTLISGHNDNVKTILQYSESVAASNWVTGGALLACCYIVSSLWYIYQSVVIKEYPAEFRLVFFYSLFAGFLAVVVSVSGKPNLRSWVIPPDVRLLSVLYSGIIGTGLSIMVHTWGLHVKGPLYVALFRPLSIAIAAIMGVIFLGEDLGLGSVIGSMVITVGFYTVMWGKSKEEISVVSSDDAHTVDDQLVVPLLKQ